MSEPLPYTLNPDRLPAIAAIVLQSDESLESDLRRAFAPEAVDLFITRIASGASVTRETLAAMESGLTASAELLPPVPLRALAYGCTSGASVIGSRRVASLVQAGCDVAHVTDPLAALIANCRAHGVTRLAVLSPYVAAVNDGLVAALADAGITVVALRTFDEAEEAKVARIDAASLIAGACALPLDDAQAIFLSCTNLKTHDVLGTVRQRTGLPAWSSNSVLIDHLRGLAAL